MSINAGPNLPGGGVQSVPGTGPLTTAAAVAPPVVTAPVAPAAAGDANQVVVSSSIAALQPVDIESIQVHEDQLTSNQFQGMDAAALATFQGSLSVAKLNDFLTPLEAFEGQAIKKLTPDSLTANQLSNLQAFALSTFQGGLDAPKVKAFTSMIESYLKANLGTTAPGGGSGPTEPSGGGGPVATEPPRPADSWKVGQEAVNDQHRTFSLVGDPHATNGDGIHYDNEKAGVFTQLQSANGDFKMQTRQDTNPYHPGVTLNTAAAVKWTNNDAKPPVSHAVSFDLKNNKLMIDKQPVDLKPGETKQLPGGGSVSKDKDGNLKITSDKGDVTNVTLRKWDHDWPYLDITGEIGPGRKDNEVRGDLGTFHSGAANIAGDFIGKDGKVYDVGQADKDGHVGGEQVEAFEDSWKADAKDDLLAENDPTGKGEPSGGGAGGGFGALSAQWLARAQAAEAHAKEEQDAAEAAERAVVAAQTAEKQAETSKAASESAQKALEAAEAKARDLTKQVAALNDQLDKVYSDAADNGTEPDQGKVDALNKQIGEVEGQRKAAHDAEIKAGDAARTARTAAKTDAEAAKKALGTARTAVATADRLVKGPQGAEPAGGAAALTLAQLAEHAQGDLKAAQSAMATAKAAEEAVKKAQAAEAKVAPLQTDAEGKQKVADASAAEAKRQEQAKKDAIAKTQASSAALKELMDSQQALTEKRDASDDPAQFDAELAKVAESITKAQGDLDGARKAEAQAAMAASSAKKKSDVDATAASTAQTALKTAQAEATAAEDAAKKAVDALGPEKPVEVAVAPPVAPVRGVPQPA